MNLKLLDLILSLSILGQKKKSSKALEAIAKWDSELHFHLLKDGWKDNCVGSDPLQGISHVLAARMDQMT